jgi:hypothetical protein
MLPANMITDVGGRGRVGASENSGVKKNLIDAGVLAFIACGQRGENKGDSDECAD